MELKLEVLKLENPESFEIIVGQGNFTVKTIEDLKECLNASTPGIEFGVAMNEAKPQLTRVTGNNEKLKELAGKACLAIGAGHVFVIYMQKAFPLHVSQAIKLLPTIAGIYLASSNPIEIILTETSLGKSILGIVDGKKATKIEDGNERKERIELVKKLGFFDQ
ncbi:MAG: adenosine-specific kinase [archaeon]